MGCKVSPASLPWVGLPGVSVDIGGAVVAAAAEVFVEEELLEKVVERSERLTLERKFEFCHTKKDCTHHTYVRTYRET